MVCSIFLPYVLTGIILITLTIYVGIRNGIFKSFFVNKNYLSLKILMVYIVMLPCIYRNWLGILAGTSIVLAIFLGAFFRTVMTHILYEKLLTLVCILSLTSTSCAIFEKIVILLSGKSSHIQRIAATFLHPNYFGTVIGTVIIICAYKIITKQGNPYFYYLIALMNIVSIYLCESMFAWVEVFIGIAMLLIIHKKHQILALWLLSATIAWFIIFVLDIKIIPRLSDVQDTISIRLKIWSQVIKDIWKSPFIGRGMFSYLFIHESYFDKNLIPHTHSVYLEMLENFGIIGLILILKNAICYFKSVANVCFKDNNTCITSLILAVSVAGAFHGITDLTLMWIQTLPLFLLILSGFWTIEKTAKV